MLPEVLKEDKEQVDMVGEEPAPRLKGSRFDHGSSSWTTLRVFPEEL